MAVDGPQGIASAIAADAANRGLQQTQKKRRRWVFYRSYRYEHHRPEHQSNYEMVETDYPKFLARLEAERASLAAFVPQEFDDNLKGGLLEHWVLRVNCDACQRGLAIANQRLSIDERGKVICTFKQPFRDGATRVFLSYSTPALPAFVPRSRPIFTRFHGVFAPVFGMS